MRISVLSRSPEHPLHVVTLRDPSLESLLPDLLSKSSLQGRAMMSSMSVYLPSNFTALVDIGVDGRMVGSSRYDVLFLWVQNDDIGI